MTLSLYALLETKHHPNNHVEDFRSYRKPEKTFPPRKDRPPHKRGRPRGVAVPTLRIADLQLDVCEVVLVITFELGEMDGERSEEPGFCHGLVVFGTTGDQRTN